MSNNTSNAFCLIILLSFFPAVHFVLLKNLSCGAFVSIKIFLIIILWWIWSPLWSEDCFYYCSERNNVVVLFGTLKVLFCLSIQCWCNDSNSNIQRLQRHNLYQTVMKKVSSNKPFVKSKLVPSEIQIAQHQFNSKTVHKEQRTATHVTWISHLLDLSLFGWLDTVTTLLTRSEWILVY